jgi:hypothetical protein
MAHATGHRQGLYQSKGRSRKGPPFCLHGACNRSSPGSLPKTPASNEAGVFLCSLLAWHTQQVIARAFCMQVACNRSSPSETGNPTDQKTKAGPRRAGPHSVIHSFASAGSPQSGQAKNRLLLAIDLRCRTNDLADLRARCDQEVHLAIELQGAVHHRARGDHDAWLAGGVNPESSGLADMQA